ncbi:hypothetical protein JQ629_05855 [Bradyrhizobium sp. AUGA SZCCT0222]|uniref:hypothetical protein n=1 Tax=Bradyrhizobium sp. AUGA SZCCT0222 TaxID=2807668 RepID=UPI001BA8A09F|nr:hypothetical protein [Bradyrhizobium sp. AUGA SZCCT0222]MBR1267032.1 hypothetical protein [Bradyrhizobium sp. AUGA SZCCT0222]
MGFLKAIGWGILFLIIALAGTLAIVIGANSLIAAHNPVMPRSGVSVYTDSWDRGYVVASGTWTMENARQAFPIQTSKIRCMRDEKTCTVAQAEIAFGNILNLETYSYDIAKWDNTTILFRTDTECVEYVYTIDRANKRLLGTRTKKPKAGAECSAVEDKALRLAFVDGFDVWKTVNQEAESKIAPIMWAVVGAWWLLFGWWFWSKRKSARNLAA